MNLDLELALRFLHRRGGRLLRGTGLASLAGVALATAALVITLALMAGYTEAIASALQRGNAHMVGFSPRPMSLDEATSMARGLEDIDGVRSTAAVTYITALIEDPIEPASPMPVVIKAVSEPPGFTGLETWPGGDELPAVLGQGLATSLRIDPGAGFRVLLPPEPGRLHLPSIPMRSAGTFTLAFSEFDSRWLVVPLGRVLTTMPDLGVAAVELVLGNPFDVEDAREEIEARLPGLIVTDWREMNRPLFAALRWQTLSLFFVLSLVVAVASFQVSSSLVILANDKRRSSGMLQALGASPARVRRVLVLAGALLGACGVSIGMLLGAGASYLLSSFRVVRFPEGLAEVYRVDHIEFLVQPTHLLSIALVCSVLIGAASLWPAWRASRMDPVKALKAV